MLKNTAIFMFGFVTACVTAVGATKIIVKNNPEPLDQAFAWYKS